MSTNNFTKPTLTIDLSALIANYRLFKRQTAGEVAGVLKADGYGLGATALASALLNDGCAQFFVATPDEGAAIRAIAEDAKIAVLGGLYHGAEDFYLYHHLIPVINSLDQLHRWRDFSVKESFALPYWLHVDTGMNRLGLGADEWATLEADPGQAEPLHMIGIMSHFACADEKDHALNDRQAERFAACARLFPDALKSLCNSSGVFRNKNWHHDLVRPGYALYGGNPTPEAENPMQRVVTLETPVLQTRRVKKGESVGYGAGHHFDQDTETATVALGYADGFLRAGSGKARLYYKGQACPILGRVSMDLISVGIGHLADKPVPGAMMEVLGPHQSLDQLADDLGTIGYEILTSLGGRYGREYLP